MIMESIIRKCKLRKKEECLNGGRYFDDDDIDSKKSMNNK